MPLACRAVRCWELARHRPLPPRAAGVRPFLAQQHVRVLLCWPRMITCVDDGRTAADADDAARDGRNYIRADGYVYELVITAHTRMYTTTVSICPSRPSCTLRIRRCVLAARVYICPTLLQSLC